MLLPPAVGRVRDCLVSTLETLPSYEFKNFKDKLRKEGFSNTPGRVLQAAEVENLTDHLLSKYGKDFELTEWQNRKDEATHRTKAYCFPVKKRIGHPVQRQARMGKHYTEKHQEEIIRRVIGIDVILDSLVAHCLVTVKQVPEIKGTTQQKMQKLYQLVPSWTTTKKNTMCRVLKETNPWLFLEQS
uniref:Pyrin domain-containing protein n=1 Tax=Varanus komodoensis TaxID=61221 RepID=A0A8D2LQ31_VARKO